MPAPQTSFSTVASALGIPESSIRDWKRRGLFVTVKDPVTGFNGVNAVGLLTIYVLKILRDGNAGHLSPPIAAFLNRHTLRALAEQLGAGNTHLYFASNAIAPILAPPKNVVNNGEDALLVVLDLGRLWTRALNLMAGQGEATDPPATS